MHTKLLTPGIWKTRRKTMETRLKARTVAAPQAISDTGKETSTNSSWSRGPVDLDT